MKSWKAFNLETTRQAYECCIGKHPGHTALLSGFLARLVWFYPLSGLEHGGAIQSTLDNSCVIHYPPDYDFTECPYDHQDWVELENTYAPAKRENGSF